MMKSFLVLASSLAVSIHRERKRRGAGRGGREGWVGRGGGRERGTAVPVVGSGGHVTGRLGREWVLIALPACLPVPLCVSSQVVKSQESAECAADIDANGSVEVNDLLALLASYGGSCMTDSCVSLSLALSLSRSLSFSRALALPPLPPRHTHTHSHSPPPPPP